MTTFNRFLPLVLSLVVLALPAPAQDTRAELAAALNRLDDAIELLESRDAGADQALEEAAATLRETMEKHDINTPGAYHALGNAYMLAGEAGHAVLAYRRGEQIDPTNPRLRESLAYARSQVPVAVEPGMQNRLWSWMMLWRGRVPRATLWWVFVGLFSAGWLACAARVLRLARRGTLTLGVWCIGVSLLPLGLLGAEWARNQGSGAVVLTDHEIVARTGPDDKVYDPAFAESLPAGVEAVLAETRDGWARLILGDGSEAWVPRTSFEMVNPSS